VADDLRGLVEAELAEPVEPRAVALAAAVAALYPRAARAVLFYGSCLRERQLDGLMLDFYLIVSDYRVAYGKSWLAAANRLIPPNVFPFEADGLTCKYAVLSEADFARLCGPDADNPSVWARFAQPSRLAWVRDEVARQAAISAVAQAAPTLIARTLPTIERLSSSSVRAEPVEAPPFSSSSEEERRPFDRLRANGDGKGVSSDSLDLWRAAFALTYAAELRAERKTRSGNIVDADPERYRRFTAPVLAAALRLGSANQPRTAALAGWRRTQRRGKALTLLRLAKASATFAGGLDYLAWKINRHAGTTMTIKPWQRRWPLLGALTLLPRLLARGAVR